MSVDLKPDLPSAARELTELVARYGAERLVTLASFSDRVVAAIRRCGYPGPTALTRREVGFLYLLPPSLVRRLIRGVSAQVPPRVRQLRLDTDTFLSRCSRLELRAEYWTINDPEVALGLVRRGATGIMTDDPARIAPRFEGLG
jgi:glycerophosphoryl diester phosphodiesterase